MSSNTQQVQVRDSIGGGRGRRWDRIIAGLVSLFGFAYVPGLVIGFDVHLLIALGTYVVLSTTSVWLAVWAVWLARLFTIR